MKTAGFDYTPVPATSFTSVDQPDWRPDDQDWVAQWGYGVIDSPESEVPGETDTDPNAAYVASLSESERDAYQTALWGTYAFDTSDDTAPSDGTASSDAASDGSGDAFDPATAGCRGAAMTEVSGGDPLAGDEFAPLREALTALYQDATTSAAQQEIDRDWAACMRAAGHDGFHAQADAAESIRAEYTSLQGDGSTAPDPAAIAAAKDDEIALAQADLECRTGVSYTDRSRDAFRAAEADFVADHRAELEAAKAAAEQARS